MKKEKELVYRNPSFQGLIGMAQMDITPSVGIHSRNWGAAKHDVSEGTHRPLSATCLCLSDRNGAPPFILVSLELGVWRSSAFYKALSSAILQEFSLPAEQLMLCLTHTHAGPSLSPEDRDKPGGALIKDYLRELEHQINTGIRAAIDTAQDRILTWNYGKCTLASNRDLYVAEEQGYLTGFNPEGKADDTLLVGRISDLNGKTTGVLVNYACHPTTLAWENAHCSPDFLGAMREIIQEQANAPCLFIQGASGDLAPKYQYVAETSVADRHGRQLGYAVLSCLEDMLPPAMEMYYHGKMPSGADLACWRLRTWTPSSELQAWVQDVAYALKDLPTMEALTEMYNSETERLLKEKLWRKRNLRIQFGNGEQAQVPFWIWKIGDAIILGQQNEAYSELQIDIRKKYPETCIGVGNLVNGSAGYLMPTHWFYEDCYPEKQTPFAAGSFERLKASMLKELDRVMCAQGAESPRKA